MFCFVMLVWRGYLFSRQGFSIKAAFSKVMRIFTDLRINMETALSWMFEKRPLHTGERKRRQGRENKVEMKSRIFFKVDGQREYKRMDELSHDARQLHNVMKK